MKFAVTDLIVLNMYIERVLAIELLINIVNTFHQYCSDDKTIKM